MRKLKEIANTPITWGAYGKVAGICVGISCVITYAELVAFGWMPNPVEVVGDKLDDLKYKIKK